MPRVTITKTFHKASRQECREFVPARPVAGVPSAMQALAWTFSQTEQIAPPASLNGRPAHERDTSRAPTVSAAAVRPWTERLSESPKRAPLEQIHFLKNKTVTKNDQKQFL